MKTKPLVVEYLIIIKQENTFCNSDVLFLKFLEVDSSLTISGNQLTVSLKKGNKLTVSYSIASDLVPSQEQRYFRFIISSGEGDKINELYDLTKLLEEIIAKLHPEASINILWNDIARKYAVEGYTLINEVENLLRRLIANFMLTKVGYDYPKYHIPNEVESRDSHLKINYSDYLHQTYFSDLKTILFEGQREFTHRNIGDIQRIVEKHISEKKKEISIDDLKGIISKSLWEKYFAKETDYKKENLEKDLEELNSLRNEIAHNRHIDRDTLGKIRNISVKIIKTLNLAIEDLSNKKLSIDEQNFQVSTENSRIVQASPQQERILLKQSIINWYFARYPSITVFEGNEYYRYIDLTIQTNSGKIAIDLRLMSTTFFKLRKQTISDNFDTEEFKQIINNFSEYHLIIAFRDENYPVGIRMVEMLNKSLNSINSKIKLIIGNIDEVQNFNPTIIF
ncbi:hypothetical protein CLU97_2130 [Chryseobacterium sp. 7]|uniref:HEPN domain-containing protein n=1 Tax=Chryseobacterium sp. 7 TaxID=2035214 RepID=UPI000EAEC0A3|nr:HEPN domain-containing protein [Chryseobacterium sp. 7]RLJ32668.1 hypothetical protein CLU97_2130 [Chryseobacterium sp. 7]